MKTIIKNGTAGNLSWSIDKKGTLTVSGEGEMPNYRYSENAPWHSQQNLLTAIVIENGVTSVGSWAFCHCQKLKSVSIPNSVKTVGHWAFSSCRHLRSVTIPEGVTFIGERAFFFCSSLRSVTVREETPSDDCHSLTADSIPQWMSFIYVCAFSRCERLTTVTIPKGITFIWSCAFSDCSSLIEIINHATTPQTIIGEEKDLFARCTLRVPNDAIETYRNAKGWGKFGKIEAIEN